MDFVNKLLNRLFSLFCIVEVIEDRLQSRPYLVRYILIRSKFLSIYIHRFLVSDSDVPHDHPWTFITLPLFKGYREHRFKYVDGQTVVKTGVTERRPGIPALRFAKDLHWVEIDRDYSLSEEHLAPLSLCIIFRHKREWGFWHDDSWVTKKELYRRLQ